MTILHASELTQRHHYLAKARPNWSQSMASIRNQGGPWECPTCDGASLLVYRCSICGAEMSGSGRQTAGRQG